MSGVSQPIVHRRSLDLLNLMHRVPEHALGSTDALIREALLEELRLSGYPLEEIELGRIHGVEVTHEGKTCLVEVDFRGESHTARVSWLDHELRAIRHFRVSVEDFAEQALELLCQAWETITVGSLDPRTDGRVSLQLLDTRTEDVVWSAEPLATCPEVLHAIREGLIQRAVDAATAIS